MKWAPRGCNRRDPGQTPTEVEFDMSNVSNDPPQEDPPPTSLPVPVIERGRAQEAVTFALNDAVTALLRLEAVAMACARSLDGEAGR